MFVIRADIRKTIVARMMPSSGEEVASVIIDFEEDLVEIVPEWSTELIL